MFCHGRLSVFWDGREVSDAAGFGARLQCLDQWHDSGVAEWEVTRREANACEARGRMPRLPLSHVWTVVLEGGRLLWKAAIECEHDVSLDAIEVNLSLPSAFKEWRYGALTGPFPDILPSDVAAMLVVPPDLVCRDVAAFPEEGSDLPPLYVSVKTDNPYLALKWMNGDYVIGQPAASSGGSVAGSRGGVDGGAPRVGRSGRGPGSRRGGRFGTGSKRPRRRIRLRRALWRRGSIRDRCSCPTIRNC